MRRSNVVAPAAAVILGLGWALAAPPGAAQAAAAPPAPVSQLSSELAAEVGAGASTDEAVASMSGAAGGVALGDAVGVSTLGTAGVVAAGGLWLGSSTGNWIVKAMPGNAKQWFTTSGSFACDVQWAFNQDTACAMSKATTYVANSDVQAREPGYDRAPAAFGIWGDSNGWTSGAFAVAQQPGGVPAYTNTSGFTLTLPLTFSGGCAGGAYNGAGVNVRVSVLDANGNPTGVQYSGWVDGTRFAGCAPAGGTLTLSLPATSTGFGGLRISGAAAAVLPGQSVQYIDWYPVGSSLRPADVPADPARAFRTDWTCLGGDTHSATSPSFHETDASWPGVPSATCSTGVPTAITVTETSTGSDARTLVSWTAPAAVTAGAAAHPQCVGGGCELLLQRIDSVSGAALDCFSSSSVCASWWTDTAGATTNTDQYRCTYGGDVVALSECTVYAHAFDVQNPTLADPRTGAAPSAAVGSSTAPQDGSCPPPFTWTSLVNPWWYYEGAVCALQAAFVPDGATLGDQLAQTQAVLAVRPPFSLLGTVQPVLGGLVSGWGGACTGNLADFTPSGVPIGLARLAIPCNPGDVGGSAFVTMYAIVSGAIVVGTMFSVWYLLGAAIGARATGVGEP